MFDNQLVCEVFSVTSVKVSSFSLLEYVQVEVGDQLEERRESQQRLFLAPLPPAPPFPPGSQGGCSRATGRVVGTGGATRGERLARAVVPLCQLCRKGLEETPKRRVNEVAQLRTAEAELREAVHSISDKCQCERENFTLNIV